MGVPGRARAGLEGDGGARRRVPASGAWNSGSIRTVPVNQSAGPLPEGCEPARLMSMSSSVRPFVEHVLGHRDGGHGVRPAGVERQVRNDLRRVRLGDTVIHRAVQVIGDLRDLTGCNERADRHQTAIARCEIWTKPEIAEQHVSCGPDQSRHDGAHLLFDARRAVSFRGFVERQQVR